MLLSSTIYQPTSHHHTNTSLKINMEPKKSLKLKNKNYLNQTSMTLGFQPLIFQGVSILKYHTYPSYLRSEKNPPMSQVIQPFAWFRFFLQRWGLAKLYKEMFSFSAGMSTPKWLSLKSIKIALLSQAWSIFPHKNLFGYEICMRHTEVFGVAIHYWT